MGGASPVSRSRAMQPDGGRQRHFLGGAGAHDRVAAHPGLGQPREIGPHAAHRARAERLDPRRFQRVEHGARIGIGRSAARVKLAS